MPHNLIDDVLNLDIPLNSKEGFVRQVLGWRIMYQVHEATDGFRKIPYKDGVEHISAFAEPQPCYQIGSLCPIKSPIQHIWTVEAVSTN